MSLRAELERLKPSLEPSPWHGHEHVRGYGVFGLPLSSGHTLALRVFPINDFAPYVTVWHLAPDGTWSIHYQAPRPDIACPRYYSAAARHITSAQIDLTWRGDAELSIHVDPPTGMDGLDARTTGPAPAQPGEPTASIVDLAASAAPETAGMDGAPARHGHHHTGRADAE